MAKKIEIGTTLDKEDWIALNEYLNDETKKPTQAALDSLRLANKINRL